MTSAAKPDLGILLAASYQQFVGELREFLADEGFPDLGRADGFVFRTLASGPVTVSDLAVRLGITKQGAAQIIDDMQSRGLVQRGHDPLDARARPVELTDRGREALRAASAFHRRTERALVKAHGSNAVATFRAMLTDLAGASADGNPQLRMGVL